MPTKSVVMTTKKELYTFIKTLMSKRMDKDERNEIIYDEINSFMERWPEHRKAVENYTKKN